MVKEEPSEIEIEKTKLFNTLYDAIEISSDESTNPCSTNMSNLQQTNISDNDISKMKKEETETINQDDKEPVLL